MSLSIFIISYFLNFWWPASFTSEQILIGYKSSYFDAMKIDPSPIKYKSEVFILMLSDAFLSRYRSRIETLRKNVEGVLSVSTLNTYCIQSIILALCSFLTSCLRRKSFLFPYNLTTDKSKFWPSTSIVQQVDWLKSIDDSIGVCLHIEGFGIRISSRIAYSRVL